MEHVVTLDIETIPSQSLDVIQRFRDDVKPPGNLKKQESIDAWLAENRDASAAEALAKTSFDPAYGHIVTIGWAIDDADIDVAHAHKVEDEADVLRAFFASIGDNHRYTFVGHYIGGFDVRFILCRAVVLGVPIPSSIPRDPKPWEGRIFDTMTAWAGSRGTISMARLCEALGIDATDDIDGSMVADAWARGDHDAIIEHCRLDVRKARNVWQRFKAVGW